ncbi:hypothetical protein NC652_037160 [Populus alba x Populus x berolinensis]|nr:hypothetical protein NC652_037160 [Populus alba x Populus x berolinensis]
MGSMAFASCPFRCAFTQIDHLLDLFFIFSFRFLELILVQFFSESEPELEIS